MRKRLLWRVFTWRHFAFSPTPRKTTTKHKSAAIYITRLQFKYYKLKLYSSSIYFMYTCITWQDSMFRSESQMRYNRLVHQDDSQNCTLLQSFVVICYLQCSRGESFKKGLTKKISVLQIYFFFHYKRPCIVQLSGTV